MDTKRGGMVDFLEGRIANWKNFCRRLEKLVDRNCMKFRKTNAESCVWHRMPRSSTRWGQTD